MKNTGPLLDIDNSMNTNMLYFTTVVLGTRPGACFIKGRTTFMIANGITTEKLVEFQKAFDKFDQKKNESIEVKHIPEALKDVGHQPTELEITQLFRSCDVQGDTRINFDFFVKMILGYIRRSDPEVEMKDAFKVFDKDGDGLIIANEIRSTMKWSDAAIAKFIRGADKNGDGMVDYNEFVRLLVDSEDMDFN